jgi:hypothetical protein
MDLPTPPSRQSLAILRHPDRQTNWTIAGLFHLNRAYWPESTTDIAALLERRISLLADRFPIIRARLHKRSRKITWQPGQMPTVRILESSTPNSMPLSEVSRFDLSIEPPIRVAVAPDGRFFTLAAHHAALDGHHAIAVAKVLCGEDIDRIVIPKSHSTQGSTQRNDLVKPPLIPWNYLVRLAKSTTAVVPSKPLPSSDSFVARELPLIGRSPTATVAAACLRAICSYNRSKGGGCKRTGVTVSIPSYIVGENTASYVRIDIDRIEDARSEIEKAMSRREMPWEFAHAPTWLPVLAPISRRLSDTFLLTNLGRISLKGILSAELYPVARGRSAVAFAMVRLQGGRSTLTLHARYLSRSDAESLLDDAINHLIDQNSRSYCKQDGNPMP